MRSGYSLEVQRVLPVSSLPLKRIYCNLARNRTSCHLSLESEERVNHWDCP